MRRSALFLISFVLALLPFAYYVDIGVSESPRAFLDLRPVPAFSSHAKEYQKTKFVDEAHSLKKFVPASGRYEVDQQALTKRIDIIRSEPLYLGLLVPTSLLNGSGTFRQQREDLRRGKEKSFWLGICLPFMIIVVGMPVALRFLRRSTAADVG